MSAINLSTLAEVESTPIPTNARMYVSVANNVYHVDDTRREIIKGEIADTDKGNILWKIKNDTPDFLLTLENKVVGYAVLLHRNGNRVNTPKFDDETQEELTNLESVYENSDMSDENYRAEKELIISNYVAKVVKPIDGAILLVAEITPLVEKHSFKKDGLTETQRAEVYDAIYDLLNEIFDDGEKAGEVADKLIEDVAQDIVETADWEDYEDDEWNSDDVKMALRRVMYSHLTN